jgi:hypothetical protein
MEKELAVEKHWQIEIEVKAIQRYGRPRWQMGLSLETTTPHLKVLE